MYTTKHIGLDLSGVIKHIDASDWASKARFNWFFFDLYIQLLLGFMRKKKEEKKRTSLPLSPLSHCLFQLFLSPENIRQET